MPPELRETGAEVGAPVPRLVEPTICAASCTATRRPRTARNTIEQIAQACQAAGYEYVGITDHSRAAAYAGGLSPDAMAMQWDEIDRVNGMLTDFRILKGIESDILVDGSLDYPG